MQLSSIIGPPPEMSISKKLVASACYAKQHVCNHFHAIQENSG